MAMSPHSRSHDPVKRTPGFRSPATGSNLIGERNHEMQPMKAREGPLERSPFRWNRPGFCLWPLTACAGLSHVSTYVENALAGEHGEGG